MCLQENPYKCWVANYKLNTTMTFLQLVCIDSQMLVVILLLLVRFTSLLDAAIAQQEHIRGVDDTPMRFQRQDSTFQQCLDTGVTNLTETDSFCANKIEGFLTATRSQPENLTLPQDVIDGICQCYNNLSEIYYNCIGTLLSVSLLKSRFS